MLFVVRRVLTSAQFPHADLYVALNKPYQSACVIHIGSYSQNEITSGALTPINSMFELDLVRNPIALFAQY
jgi:hypothetical protein